MELVSDHDPYLEELARHLQVDHGCGHYTAAFQTWARDAVNAAKSATVLGPDGNATIAIPVNLILEEHRLEVDVFHMDHHREPDGEGGHRVIRVISLHPPLGEWPTMGGTDLGSTIPGSFEDA